MNVYRTSGEQTHDFYPVKVALSRKKWPCIKLRHLVRIPLLDAQMLSEIAR